MEPGALTQLHNDYPDTGMPFPVTGASATWQCWNGERWVDTHLLMKDGYGPGGRSGVVLIEPEMMIQVPAIGIRTPSSRTIEIPNVDPGMYRIADTVAIEGTQVVGYVIVEVADPE